MSASDNLAAVSSARAAEMSSSPESVVSALEARAEQRKTAVDGCEIVWRQWGAGRPVLLLHGNFGSWSHWMRNIPTLSQRVRLIVPDMPGFGDSGPAPEPHTPDGLARRLEEGLSAIGLGDGPVTIVGFSFGTTIAGALARMLGTRVERLVIVSAGQVGARRHPITPFVSWRKLRTQEERDAAHRSNLGSMMISDPDKIDPLAVYLQSANTARRTLATEAITADHPLRSILFSLDCKIDAIWGEKDKTIGPYMQDRLDLVAQLGPRVRAFVVQSAGHWLQYEAPSAFNGLIVEGLGLPEKPTVSREEYVRWLS